MKTKKLAVTALLAAVALTVFVIESNIPPLTPIPGIKPGLSNIVTLFAVYVLGPGSAFFVLIVRIFLGSIITGQMAAVIYSFAGGIPALLFGAVTRKVFGYRLIWVQSAISAVIHNAGQMAAAVLITGTGEIAVYMPVLVISGIVTGVFTGVCAYLVILALEKRGFVNGEGTLN